MATTYDIDMIQGNTFSGRLISQNSDGTYINLSGYTTSGSVKYRYSQTTALFNLNPVVHSSYVSGIVDISVTASTLLSQPVGEYIYDINQYAGNGFVQRLLNGKCIIAPSGPR